jgi:hypothetical protein
MTGKKVGITGPLSSTGYFSPLGVTKNSKPANELSATVRTGPSGEAFVFLIVATRCALSGPGSASGLFDQGANKTI